MIITINAQSQATAIPDRDDTITPAQRRARSLSTTKAVLDRFVSSVIYKYSPRVEQLAHATLLFLHQPVVLPAEMGNFTCLLRVCYTSERQHEVARFLPDLYYLGRQWAASTGRREADGLLMTRQKWALDTKLRHRLPGVQYRTANGMAPWYNQLRG